MNSEKNNIEQKIMNDIKSGKVKLRSKYIFLAEKLGVGSAFILSLLLAILFFNLLLFYLKTSDNLAYLSFGNHGVAAFLDSFPYLLVVSFVILVFVSAYIIKQSNWLYKKPFVYLAVSLVGFVILSGIVLTYTNIADSIEEESYNSRLAGNIFRPFLHRGLGERHGGIVGRVMENDGDLLTIQTPRSVKKVDISNLEESVVKPLVPGVFVMIVGNDDDGLFQAVKLRIIKEQEIQMVNKAVRRRFGSFTIHNTYSK